MLKYKIVNNKSLESVQYYLSILLWPVYYGNQHFHLKNNNKNCAFVLFKDFTCIIFSSYQLVVLLKLHCLGHNYSNFIYIFLKLKLLIPKYISLKWVFLPQWCSWKMNSKQESLNNYLNDRYRCLHSHIFASVTPQPLIVPKRSEILITP